MVENFKGSGFESTQRRRADGLRAGTRASRDAYFETYIHAYRHADAQRNRHRGFRVGGLGFRV